VQSLETWGLKQSQVRILNPNRAAISKLVLQNIYIWRANIRLGGRAKVNKM